MVGTKKRLCLVCVGEARSTGYDQSWMEHMHPAACTLIPKGSWMIQR